MENDKSAESFDAIICQSGQFGFFQKRLFLINTLIQSACISVLLYTCACMPEVDENDDNPCGGIYATNLEISVNGHHYPDKDAGFSNSGTTTEYPELPTHAQNRTALLNDTLHAIFNQNLSTFITTITFRAFLENTTTERSSDFSHPKGTSTESLFPTVTAASTLEYILGAATNISSNATSFLDIDSDKSNSTEFNLFRVLNMYRENITNLGVDIEHIAKVFSEQTRNASWHNNNFYENKVPNAFSEENRNTSWNNDKFYDHKVGEIKSDNVMDFTIRQPEISSVNFSDFSTDFVTTQSSSTTSNGNATPTCSRGFILFRTDLRRTQILQDLSLAELLRVTSYAQGIGMIVGALLGSMMADIYGRRKLLYLFLAGMLILHCLMAASISWTMFIFLRTLAVGCAGATLVISFVTVVEFVGPDWRDACTCSCFWTLGAILLSLETLVTLHWRLLALMSGGICLPLLATFFSSTESLRWLQCHHRFSEAEWGFREVVSVNSTAVPDLTTLLDQSRGCIVNNMHSKKFTFLDLFHSLDSAKWTLVLVYVCTVSSTVYFSLFWRVKEMTSLVYFDGFLPFVIDLPLTWSVVVLNRCLGRRWCLFLYSVASGFALMSVLILHITGNVDFLPSLVTGLALFGKIGVTASLSLILLLAIEMYPTVTRCMGVAVAVASATGGSMLFNAFVFLERCHYTVPFVVYGLMMSSIGVLGLVFPETFRKPLKNVQQCRHRKIPLMEGLRLVGRPPSLWDAA